MRFALALPLAMAALAPSAARAAATDWIEQEGARIRLVAAEPTAEDAAIRAALVVELKPGWKTYWRDPGDAGVPPLLTLTGGSNVQSSVMEFPAPERFEEGAAKSIGYKEPVSFPLTFSLQAPGKPSAVKATAFLGVCEEICIPVQVEFALDVPVAVGSTADQALVQAAFDALPGAPGEGFGLASLGYQPKALEIEIAAPPSASQTELFIAAERFLFGVPQLVSKQNGKSRYSIPIVFAPKTAKIEDTEVFYTIKSGGKAVSGSVPPRAN